MAEKCNCDREAVLQDILSGMTYKEISQKHNISQTTVSRIAAKNKVKKYRKGSATIKADEEWERKIGFEWMITTWGVMEGLKSGAKIKTDYENADDEWEHRIDFEWMITTWGVMEGLKNGYKGNA